MELSAEFTSELEPEDGDCELRFAGESSISFATFFEVDLLLSSLSGDCARLFDAEELLEEASEFALSLLAFNSFWRFSFAAFLYGLEGVIFLYLMTHYLQD